MSANELNEPNMFAPIATVAAFTQGEEWSRQMLSYIEGNVLYVEQFFKENIPAIQAIRPEASFLVWLDCQHTFCRSWFHASQCRLPSLHPPASHVPIAQCVSNLSEKVITRDA